MSPEELGKLSGVLVNTMPKVLAPDERLSEAVGIRLPRPWLHEINYLIELRQANGEAPTLSGLLRELIQVGGEQVGLDLDD